MTRIPPRIARIGALGALASALLLAGPAVAATPSAATVTAPAASRWLICTALSVALGGLATQALLRRRIPSTEDAAP